jgi:integrase
VPQRRKGKRVLGPYKRGRSYAIAIIDDGGERTDREFESEAKAEAAKRLVEQRWGELDAITVEQALTEYERHLERKGTKPVSFKETLRRLRLFFTKPDRVVGDLNRKECAAYYEAFTEGRSVDYHRNTLSEARSFLRWCAGKEWIRANPLEGVEGIGRRSKGKAQLTADEAFRFAFAALWMANDGDAGALGAAMLLYLGLRQSEVWKRRVRDLDRNGTVLRIEDAKTKAGERQVEVPDLLQPYLADLVRGRLPLAPLFPANDGGHHTKAWLRFAVERVCAAAGVPEVTPHGLRGTFSTLGEGAHVASHAVAGAIGHAGMSAYGSYAKPEAVQAATAARVLSVINGGRR